MLNPKSREPPLYETLGLKPGASPEEVRAAYRKLAKQTHPDANPEDPGSEELFKKVADAYRILSNPASRSHYDRAAGFRSPEPNATSSEKETRPELSRDVNVRLHLTLAQACQGGRRELKIPRKTPCPKCNGNGFTSWGEACQTCSHSGVIKKTSSVEVAYPAGVRTGSRLKFSAYGHRFPPDNISGDLIVEIVLKPDHFLEVKGSDFHYRALLGLDVFIEGGRIVVPLPGGATAVEIPPRMSDGRILKLGGKGLPAFQNVPAGDLFLKIELCVPKRLSRKERQLLHELMALPGFHPPADADGFIPKGD